MAALTPADYERLERAIVRGQRISVARRGTEFIIVPLRLAVSHGREEISARHPTTGELLSLVLDEIDSFEVIG